MVATPGRRPGAAETPADSSGPACDLRSGDELTLVWTAGDGVGFLDAPGVDARVLLVKVGEVLAGMAPGAILTVYSDDPATSVAAGGWCTGHFAELVAIIRHECAGTTLTFRRS